MLYKFPSQIQLRKLQLESYVLLKFAPKSRSQNGILGQYLDCQTKYIWKRGQLKSHVKFVCLGKFMIKPEEKAD